MHAFHYEINGTLTMIINHVSSRRGDQVAKDLKDQLERKEVG